MNPRSITIVEHEIDALEKKIQVLRKERHELLKARRRYFDEYMAYLYEVIKHNPGIDKKGIISELDAIDGIKWENKLTALVRRGAIVNKGTRQSPSWYCV